MNEKQNIKKRPSSERMEALRRLPSEIMKYLTKAEIDAFLFDEVWPDSLRSKLKDYLVEEE